MADPSPRRFVSPGTPPTPRQRELGVVLVEECTEVMLEMHLARELLEVQQRTTKLLRFGLDEVQPGQKDSNLERLSLEVGDLQEVIRLALEAKLLDPGKVTKGMLRKRRQMERFLHSDPD